MSAISDQHHLRVARRRCRPGQSIAASRSCSAYSLVAVICIGVISSLWVAAMMASMLPTYEKILSAKVGGLTRMSAESAIDYTIDQINAGFSNGVSSSNLDAAALNSSKTTLLSGASIGNTGGQVSVTVYNELPPSTSMFYDSMVATLVNTGVKVGTVPIHQTVGMKNPFRRIEATASIGGYSRTVKVIAGPVFGPPPFFPFAAFGGANVVPIGLAGTDSYNVPKTDPYGIYGNAKFETSSGNYNLYGDLGSNTAINYVQGNGLLRGITIGGNHWQYNLSAPAAGGGSSGSSSLLSWLNIYDNVYTDGNTSGLLPRGQFPHNIGLQNNVYGWSNWKSSPPRYYAPFPTWT